ncbi:MULTISPECIES: hypothetical protein [unclassified Myroides]|uniref:hypothetical protein n=1 Tax=unclassified Myroides TaxID=2642485 RepID=UPI0031010FE0
MNIFKITVVFLVFSFINIFAQSGKVHYPFFLTLQEGTDVPKGLYLPEREKNSARFTKYGLKLTPLEQQRFGAVLMDDMAFMSSNGIDISFEFNVYDGPEVEGTDGFIVFLYDGATSSEEMQMGATGRSMGYMYNRASEDEKLKRRKGLPNAYLGVSLNITGNFKNRAFQSDIRISGIKGHNWPALNSWTVGQSHVTLRGAEYKLPDGDPMQGYRGYPVLKTVSTLKTDSQTNGSAELNDDGTYSFGPSFSQKTSFSLRNGKVADNEDDENFRKAFISLLPHREGGLVVTVKIQHGKVISTIIDKYHYKTKVTYFENAEAKFGDFTTKKKEKNVAGEDVKFVLDAPIPKIFKVGFAGITGGRTDIHMIRNLLISVPYSAVATDKNMTVCDKTASKFYAFTDDYAYTNHISNPIAGNENIDPASFVFYSSDGTTAIEGYRYADTNGTWIYDPNISYITFIPNDNFVGNKATVRYSMKAKEGGTWEPYGDEMYRSNPASITLTAEECPIYVNPNIRMKPN